MYICALPKQLTLWRMETKHDKQRELNFGIVITKSIKNACQWSQQFLQTIALPPALFWHL
jgi:hypothetical protein